METQFFLRYLQGSSTSTLRLASNAAEKHFFRKMEKGFEGDPKEVTADFEYHVLSDDIPLRPELIEQFVQKLDSLSSSGFMKSITFLAVLNHSLSGEERENIKELNLSEFVWRRLEEWLKTINDSQREQMVETLSRGKYTHLLLLDISKLSGNLGPRFEWTGVEKLALSYFRKTIDSYILLGEDKNIEDRMFGNEFQKPGNSRLRQTILKIAMERMKSITPDNAQDLAHKAYSLQKVGRSKSEKLDSTQVFRSMVKFINWSARTLEGPGIKLPLAFSLRHLQENIFDKWFKGYHFPKATSIQVLMKENPGHAAAERFGNDVPNSIPDYGKDPFDQLERLKLLGSLQFDQLKPEVSRFFGDILFSDRPLSQNQKLLHEGVGKHYRDKYDTLVADEIIQRISEVEIETIPRVFEIWKSLRHEIGHEPLKISGSQLQELSRIAHAVPDSVLLHSKSALKSLDVIDNLGRLKTLLKPLSLEDMKSLLDSLQELRVKSNVLDTFLLAMADKKPTSVEGALSWLHTVEAALTLKYSDYSATGVVQNRLREVSKAIMLEIPHEKILAQIKGNKLRSVLNQEEVAKVFQREGELRLKTASNDLTKLPESLSSLEKEFGLERSDSITSEYRNLLAQSLKIQPHQRSLIDPKEGQTLTEMGSGNFSTLVRGFSGLLEIVRALSFKEQISFIQYINGKSSQLPGFVERLDKNENIQKGMQYSHRNLETWTREARQKMNDSDEITRSLVIHSFLTGPTGIINDPNGLSQLENILLREVPAESRASTQLVMRALKAAEGREYGLLLSYALAQRNIVESRAQNAPTGAGLLKAFLESYGVPGTKFGQFMAFSSRFKAFRSAFESFQDSALPLSYIGMLKLLEKSLGVTWDPSRFEVIEIIGSGSVNIAVTVKDLKLGTKKIINVLREDVEVQAKNDFLRFQRFVNELNKLSANTDLAFIGGVARLVEDSVSYEFNKSRAKQMHDLSEVQYSHRVGDWTVRSVHVSEVLGRSLIMDIAPGVSARQVLNSHPHIYKSAMSAFLTVAKQRIRGLGVDGKSTNKPVISDPDIHNGQFFIDEKTKTITLLDKGQSSTPSVIERELSKTLFRMSTQMVKGPQVQSHLKPFESMLGLKLKNTHLERIQQIQKLDTPIDRYLNLVGYLREVGFVPTATVDWGFEFYRLYELASQVDRTQEWEIKSVLLEGPMSKMAQAALGIVKTVTKKNIQPLPLHGSMCIQFYR